VVVLASSRRTPFNLSLRRLDRRIEPGDQSSYIQVWKRFSVGWPVSPSRWILRAIVTRPRSRDARDRSRVRELRGRFPAKGLRVAPQPSFESTFCG
jgi:hypothetical protein